MKDRLTGVLGGIALLFLINNSLLAQSTNSLNKKPHGNIKNRPWKEKITRSDSLMVRNHLMWEGDGSVKPFQNKRKTISSNEFIHKPGKDDKVLNAENHLLWKVKPSPNGFSRNAISLYNKEQPIWKDSSKIKISAADHLMWMGDKTEKNKNKK